MSDTTGLDADHDDAGSPPDADTRDAGTSEAGTAVGPDAVAVADADAEPTVARRPRTVPAGAFVAVLMVAAALGVLAVVALSIGGDGGGDDRDVRLAAGRFAERFLTFDHDAIDEWKQDVLTLSTGGFADEVGEVESGLRQLITETRLDAVTQVTDIFVGTPERGAVDVVVIYDRELRTAEGTRSEDDRYMQLSLVRVDGAWLVDSVIDVVTAGGIGSAVADESSPTTAGG